MYKIWINADSDGYISGAYGGYEHAIFEPTEQYDYYFEVSDVVYKSIGNYKVENGELIERA